MQTTNLILSGIFIISSHYVAADEYYCIDEAAVNAYYGMTDCASSMMWVYPCMQGKCPIQCDYCEFGVSIMIGCGGENPGQCVECQICSAGHYMLEPCFSYPGYGYRDTTCYPCNPGTFSAREKSEWCEPCLEGTYSESYASTVCSLCAPGTYADVLGSVTCPSCAPGTYATAPGSVSCQPCPENTYQLNSGASSCTVCEMCPVGYYRVACGGTNVGECTECTNTS